MRPAPRSINGRFFRLLVLLVAGMLGFFQLTLADEKTVDQKDAAKPVAPKPPKAEKKAAIDTTVTPEREAAALEFAQQNHPELVSLLQNLKSNAPKKYQAALIELGQTIDRLAKIKDPERRESQLAEWKLSSRIRLLAARQAVSDDPALESELRAALREQLDFRLAMQRAERDRLQKRVEKLDQSIESMTTNSDALIDKQLADLKKTMPVAKAVKAKAKRPTAVAPADEKGEK